jgi:uncharacterized integral membrane protein
MADFWERKSPKQKTKFILGIILLVLVIVFAIANWVKVPFSFIFKTVELPLTAIILASMVFGYIFSAFTEGNYKKKREQEEHQKLEDNNQQT